MLLCVYFVEFEESSARFVGKHFAFYTYYTSEERVAGEIAPKFYPVKKETPLLTVSYLTTMCLRLNQ